jgi:microcystin-dependent protein
MIMLWSGSVASIPSGWALCNGSNGTPDLRNRFVVGAGSTYAVAATGGSADAIVVSHTHTATSSVTDPQHSHNAASGQFVQQVPSGGVDSTAGGATKSYSTSTASASTGISVSTTVNSTGSSGTNANLPPYYALAYIMKT